MNEILILFLVWVIGGLLGAFFFGGLWWTVRKALASERPALWIFLSLMLRTGITVSGFYLVSGEHWQRLLICLLGFITARWVVQRFLGSTAESLTPAPQESGHAP